MPKSDPSREITDEQRAAAMPWGKLQLSLMGVGLIFSGLLLAYVVYTGMHDQTNWYVVAVWYLAAEIFFTGSSCYCACNISRILGDHGTLFHWAARQRMFLRPFVVIAVLTAFWKVPQWFAGG
jgi:hypothetical protein